MLFKQFYLPSLGHASYFLGSEQTGEALIVDARRDVDIYFAEARRQEMRIRYATDTHQHNDYVTGICELPERGDVQLLSGARAELGYKVRAMADEECIDIGEIRCQVLHTPGHTPEHISLLITDRSRGTEPAFLFSGGALLVGDVARPDLLGDSSEIEHNAELMCHTLQEKILKLPDHVQVYPTHVAGSLCGGHIGSRLSTTIGYERRANKMLAGITSKQQFVRHCLDLKELPAVPPYWRRMRKMNQAGPPALGVLREPPALRPAEFDQLHSAGAVIIDSRSAEAFGGAHIAGALNVAAGSAFPTWAGTVLPASTPYLLVVAKADDVWDICWELLRIGYELPQGWLAGGMTSWRTSGMAIKTLPLWTVWDLRDQLQSQRNLVVLDVRQPQEWGAGHIDNAIHITGAELPQRIEQIPKDKSVAVICGSGYRSSVAASLLAQQGHTRVANVLGGMAAWRNAGLPTVRPAS